MENKNNYKKNSQSQNELTLQEKLQWQNSAIEKIGKVLRSKKMAVIAILLCGIHHVNAQVIRAIKNGGASSKTIKELTISATESVGGALQDASDEISFTIKYGASTDTTADLPSSSNVASRVTNSWKLTISDANNNGGLLNLTFDIGFAPN